MEYFTHITYALSRESAKEKMQNSLLCMHVHTYHFRLIFWHSMRFSLIPRKTQEQRIKC